MTVLQRKEATGVDSAMLGKVVGSVALLAAIGFGFAVAMSNIEGTETVAPASIGAQAPQGLAQSAEANQAVNGAIAAASLGTYGLTESALANQALNGKTVASVAGPFLAGHPSQTHKGRNGVKPASGSEWSTVGDPISDRIPDYSQGDAAGTSGDVSGFNSGDLFAR